MNQYGMTWGQPSLRAAIAAKSRRFYGQEVDPDKHVTVTCGVTEAVIAALLGKIARLFFLSLTVSLTLRQNEPSLKHVVL
jgi:hypothetical protein